MEYTQTTKKDMKAYNFISQKYVTTEPPYLLKSISNDLFRQESNYFRTGRSQQGQTAAFNYATFPGIDAFWCILARP